MSQVRIETDLTEWFIQATFITSLVFAVVYGMTFKWRATVTGRSFMLLSAAICGTLLHSCLLVWRVTKINFAYTHHTLAEQQDTFNQVLTWIGLVSLGFAAVAMLLLLWQTVRYLAAEKETEREWVNKILHLGHNHDKVPGG